MDQKADGKNLVVVWASQTDSTRFKSYIENIQNSNSYKTVSEEFLDTLESRNYSSGSFTDAAVLISSVCGSSQISKLLGEVLRILMPNGKLVVIYNEGENQLISDIKMAGFTKVSSASAAKEFDTEYFEISACKPGFEVGSSVKLNLASKESAWKLDLEDDEVELNDPDDLLTEEDYAKPDPASLRVCGSTGKRKACKDCTCGLKEELDNETVAKIEENRKNFKSSCGSCYLGDAFRCASCPYLGMPAFKPGEVVKLADETL